MNQLIVDILNYQSSTKQLKRYLSASEMNWDLFVQISSKHLVLPTAYCQLIQKGLLSVLPHDLREYLYKLTEINRNRNAEILIQIKELSTAFDKKNICHTFLKGGALLAGGYYSDSGERMIGDIDVLVLTQDLKKARALLLKMEYYEGKSPLIFGKYTFHRHGTRLIHKQRLAAVEIHTQIIDQVNDDHIETENILKTKRKVNNIWIPNYCSLYTHLILNDMINDRGFYNNSISCRTLYDSFVLDQIKEPNSTIIPESKETKKFFVLRKILFNISEKSPSLNFIELIYYSMVKKRLFNNLLIRVNLLIGLFKDTLSILKLYFSDRAFRAHLCKNKKIFFKKIKNRLKLSIYH